MPDIPLYLYVLLVAFIWVGWCVYTAPERYGVPHERGSLEEEVHPQQPETKGTLH